MPNLTGCGPRRDNGSCLNRLLFDRDEERYEIWETKFLGHLRSLGLKDAILGVNITRDNERNEEAYAKLLQFLDDKILSLIMREAANNEKKKPSTYYADTMQEKENQVILLYTQSTSL